MEHFFSVFSAKSCSEHLRSVLKCVLNSLTMFGMHFSEELKWGYSLEVEVLT